MLGLTQGMIEVDGRGENNRVAHLVEGVGNAVRLQVGQEIGGWLRDLPGAVRTIDLEFEGKMVAQISLGLEELAHLVDGAGQAVEIGVRLKLCR